MHGGLHRHEEMAAQSGLRSDNGHTSKSALAASCSIIFAQNCACAGWRTRLWTRWGASTQLPPRGARHSPAHPPRCTPRTRYGFNVYLILLPPKAALLPASLLAGLERPMMGIACRHLAGAVMTHIAVMTPSRQPLLLHGQDRIIAKKIPVLHAAAAPACTLTV